MEFECNVLNSERFNLTQSQQIFLIDAISGHKREEELWKRILECLIPECISDNLFEYLINNHFCIMDLSHMDLKDSFLIKLADYDSEPIYKLAEHYFNHEKYTNNDFVAFYKEYLRNHIEIIDYLLEYQKGSPKISLLSYLYENDKEISNKKTDEIILSCQVKYVRCSQELKRIYEENRDSGIILYEIAKNPYASDDILTNLAEIRGIDYSRKIRIASKETSMIKKMLRR